jgi:hypothetical protein
MSLSCSTCVLTCVDVTAWLARNCLACAPVYVRVLVGRQPGGSEQDRVLRAAKRGRPIVCKPLCPFFLPWLSINPAAPCSPALSGYRGMRDREAAKTVGHTVHASDNACVYGDSCRGQRDTISNLTQEMSDMFHVEFHAATAKAKSFREFIKEVQKSMSLSRPRPDFDDAIAIGSHAVVVVVLVTLLARCRS